MSEPRPDSRVDHRQPAHPDRVRLGLALLDCAGGVLLATAAGLLRGAASPVAWTFGLTFGGLGAAAWVLAGGHGRWRSWATAAAGAGAVGALLVGAALLAGRAAGAPVTPAAAAWLAGAGLAAGGVGRLLLRHWGTEAGWPGLLEALRLTSLAAVTAWIAWPFLTSRPIGAGDAYWYTLMLADFVEQARLGQFPVWTGATEFAFNGAVSPLRLAPWFQHVGLLVDVVTGESLAAVALKNTVIAANFGAITASAYLVARALLVRQPWMAWAVALVYVLSPATLAPLYVGDQYMTFLALPFLPIACYALARCLEGAGLAHHLALGTSVGLLWLSHPPIGLWATLFAAAAFVPCLLRIRSPAMAVPTLAGAAAFLAFAGYSVVSVGTLENTLQALFSGLEASRQVSLAFPAWLLPLSRELGNPSDYQVGYAALGLLAFALVGLPFRRSIAAVIFSGLMLAIVVLCAPVPFVTEAIWRNVPDELMRATNIWPMQRLFPIWLALIAVTFAVVYARHDEAVIRRLRLPLALGLAPLVLWSAHQADRLRDRGLSTVDRTPGEPALFSRHNALLTRYAFVSFEWTPAYFSHGYIDARLEHRLLRADRSPLISNAEAATGRDPFAADRPAARLLESGPWRAVNDNNTDYYNLEPKPAIPAREHLALRVNFAAPAWPGYLQYFSRDIFREYALPDSGFAMDRRTPPRAFGSLASSPQVIPLYSEEGGPAGKIIHIVSGRPERTDFDFGSYELWSYDPKLLPVAVHSWVPYRLIVHAPEAGYVETPRLWLSNYRAKINGQRVPVERSPDNLAMFRVPAGRSDITIKFAPPLTLEVAFWICLTATAMALAVGLPWLAREAAGRRT